MRLSESILKGLTEVRSGSLFNKFGVKKRRSVFFFEEILADYVLAGVRKKKSKQFEESGYKWLASGFPESIPTFVRTFPTSFMNTVVNRMHITTGAFDSLKVSVLKGDRIKIEVENPFTTRVHGKNPTERGCWRAMVSAIYGREAVCVHAKQSRKRSEFVFRLGKRWHPPKCKDRKTYLRLNREGVETGPNLSNLLSRKEFVLRDNNLCFKGHRLVYSENTTFHLAGIYCLLPKDLLRISEKFANRLFERTTREKKLKIVKALFEATGWGKLSVSIRGKRMVLKMVNPPYGFQIEKDNWVFFSLVFAGFLRREFPRIKLRGSKLSKHILSIFYSL